MAAFTPPNVQMSDVTVVASFLWERDRMAAAQRGEPLVGKFLHEKWTDVSTASQAHYMELANVLLERQQDKRDNVSQSMDLPDLARTYRLLLKRWLNKLDRETSGRDVDDTKLALMDQQLKKVADALDKLSAVEVRIKREALEEWVRMSVRDKSDRMLQEVQSWPEGSKDEFRERFEVACPSRKLKAVR